MQVNFVKHPEKNYFQYAPERSKEVGYKDLPAGIYAPLSTGGMMKFELSFRPVEVKEELVQFDSGIVRDVIQKIEDFFSTNTAGKYEDIGICHKMGMLLYGPPGTGKTCTAMLIIDAVVKKYGAIGIDMTDCGLDLALLAMRILRDQDKNIPLILFCDEAEEHLTGSEHKFLPFLDGNNSIAKSIFIGCTNYLDKVPRRISERKSRIKHTFEINTLPVEVYKQYLIKKATVLPMEMVTEMSHQASEQGLTIDQLKHALIDYYVEDVRMDKAIKNAKKISTQQSW